MSTALVPTLDTGLTHNFSDTQLEALAQPLSVQFIRERKGPAGKLLKYITTKTAIDTANRLFGIGKWGYRVLARNSLQAGSQVFYTADIELYVLGCPFPFPGEGEGIPANDTPEQHAKARKEAVSDALKRALRHFGDQFGLALYDEESLVEDANGDLTRVKDVHPAQGQPQQARRVVNAQPSQATQGQSQSNKSTPHLAQTNRDKINALLGEYKEAHPDECKGDAWVWKVLRQALFKGGSGVMPTTYTAEHIEALTQFVMKLGKQVEVPV